MAEEEPKTRKAYRQAQQAAAQESEQRDRKRQDVEREYARDQRKAKRPKVGTEFDERTYKKVNSMKKKLNWAIGIVIVLIIVVGLVLFLV
ncbi:hypothetical protein [Lacticaseibacillus sp. GG6-2]